MQQHQREQAPWLRLRRQELDEHAPEPNGLLAQVTPHQPRAETRAVALVEHEVHDHHHRLEPFAQRIVGRHFVRNACGADLGLGANNALRHGRRRHQECARDLFRRQTPERAERERHLRLGGERGMAAREDEPQPVLGHRQVLLPGQLEVLCDLLFLLREAGGPAQPVDGFVPPGADEPCHGVRRLARCRPLLESGREGLLQPLLGQVEVAQQPDQRGQDPPVFRVEQLVDSHGLSMGRLPHPADARTPAREPEALPSAALAE
jgi:hypothetical protein